LAWNLAKQWTPARLQLGRSGVSQPIAAQLSFSAAHAMARDAVARPMDHAALQSQLEPVLSANSLQAVFLESAAQTQAQYLRRPDLGRRLSDDSRERLPAVADPNGADLVFVLGDGLSSAAIEHCAAPLLAHALPALIAAAWKIAPIAIAKHARVAVGDDVAACLQAKAVVVLIGERPGLSSPMSMGAYFTWAPQVGMRDALRSCISNIRADGLPPEAAADQLVQALLMARNIGATGLALQHAQAAQMQIAD
jgi:ethanolamine ammonia-lyase small subunit